MSIQIRVVGLVASAIVASAASAQTAVEWKVSEGGNGHWYASLSRSTGITWSDARSLAQATGGDLASLETLAEKTMVMNTFGPSVHPEVWVYQVGWGEYPNFGPWLGAFQVSGSAEPSGGWKWLTGASFDPLEIACCNDDCGGVNEDRLHLYFSNGQITWNDLPAEIGPCGNWPNSCVVEWSADCNNDGIVDYGQILSGELDDDNTNGIPDICETSVTGVIPPSVPSQGGATVTIKGANFPENPTVLLGGVAATDVVRLSATRITATSPALLPGMASISVSGFTLPEALYIRPECGSDLDQNGSVDGGDMAILLLDWGPCYAPPGALAAPAPTPLLVPDESTPAPTPPAPQSARPAPMPRERSS
jgi:hypothetical protein